MDKMKGKSLPKTLGVNVYETTVAQPPAQVENFYETLQKGDGIVAAPVLQQPTQNDVIYETAHPPPYTSQPHHFKGTTNPTYMPDMSSDWSDMKNNVNQSQGVFERKRINKLLPGIFYVNTDVGEPVPAEEPVLEREKKSVDDLSTFRFHNIYYTSHFGNLSTDILW